MTSNFELPFLEAQFCADKLNMQLLPSLFSDLCLAFGSSILSLVDVEPIAELLTQGRRSKVAKTKTLSQWATKEIRKLKNAINNVSSNTPAGSGTQPAW